IIVFSAAFVIVALLYTAVFSTKHVRQSSKQDTLMKRQHLIVEKVSCLFGKPSRGDVIVFIENRRQYNYWDRVSIFLVDISEIFKPVGQKTNIRLVKRVIGVPGDTIDIRGGKVFRNGEPLDEPYAKGATYKRELDFPVTVPEGKYFVLGDNREISKDSRSFGFIDHTQVEGKAIFRFWPFSEMGIIH
ncbi:MAG: signal peptidase I, partial [Bacillota bacterium]